MRTGCVELDDDTNAADARKLDHLGDIFLRVDVMIGLPGAQSGEVRKRRTLIGEALVVNNVPVEDIVSVANNHLSKCECVSTGYAPYMVAR